MKFNVVIVETLQKEVEIEADDKDTAIKLVKQLWNNAEIILSSDDFTGVDFY